MTVATTKGVAEMSPGRISTKKPTATIHYLKEDKGNKYVNNKRMKKSIEYNGMIPFLRDHNEKYTLGRRSLTKYKKIKAKSLAHKRLSKELQWNRVGFPISMHNEKNHFSKKVKFEDL